jgi:hypothetical protein
VVGLLIGLEDEFEITSNREAGHGRYDIMLKPRHERGPGLIFEIKQV